MSDARLPINHWDTGKVSRDKINDSFNDLVTTVQWYEPSIVGWYWYIWTTATWVKAQWDNVEMKVEDWYIRYKSSSVNQRTQIIAVEDLKWDKWDTGDAATVCVWNVSTGNPWTDVCVTNSGTQYAAVLNFTIPRGATGCQWETGASICAATFCGDDMVFTKDNGCQVVLCDAKDELKWDTGRAATVAVGCVTTWEPWTCVCIVNTGTCCDAILDFTIPQGVKWDRGNAATITVWTTCTWEPWTCACVTNSWTCCDAVLNFTVPKWLKWDTGDTGARIVSAWFSGNDIVFTEDNSCTVTLCNAKTCLKWDKWDTWDTGARIVCAEFSDNDIVFTEDNSCTVTLCDAKTCLKWDKGDTWNAATITVGTTCTWWAWTAACVTNSGTSCAAILDFTIPKWCQWDKGDTGASIVSAAFSSNDIVFTKDDSCTVTLCDAKTCLKWDQWNPWPTWNGISCVTTSKSWKTTTVCMEYTSWAPTVFQIQDGADGSGSGDMCTCTYDPSGCMSDVFDYCNFYNTPDLSCKQDTLTAWENIEINNNVISANNVYIIPESDITKTTTKTKWVAPYNTDYYYSNFEISEDAGIKWVEWAQYIFLWDTLTAATTYRNARFRIGSEWDWIPLMNAWWTILNWYTYIKKAYVRPYLYSTRYQEWWALHLMQDDNSTYTALTPAVISTWTATTAQSISAANLRYAIDNFSPSQVDDTAYDSSWDWVTDKAPSQNSMYAKIESISSSIPTDNCQLSNSCGYTTCTWTLVASDIQNLAQCCDIPTDNCQLSNSCGYTTCTGTLVASDLTPYAKTCNLCTVATSGKYCDLTWQPTIPTNNNQLTNGCGYTTCTWTLTASDLTPYAKSCDLKAVATSWEYCDLTWTPTIPTNNNQLTNWCWYTTCTWTLVASDLNGYAQTSSLCTVATSWKYCDLTGQPTIPTDNCQLWNSCWFTTCTGTLSTCSDVISALWYTPYSSSNPSGYTSCTWTLVASDIQCLAQCCDIPTDNCQLANGCGYTTCTWTLVSSDLAPYAKTCDLATVATSGKYCDLTWQPTIPTNNNQLTNGCGYTTCTGTLTAETVVSGVSGTTYIIKVSNSEPSSWTPSTTITFVP